MATSGVAGLVYGTKLIDLATGGVISFADVIAAAGGGGAVACVDPGVRRPSRGGRRAGHR